MDQLLAPLAKSVKKKAAKEEAASGPQADRSMDLAKSALRAVLAVNGIEDIGSVSRGWAEFYDSLRKDEFTNSLMQSIEKEKAYEVM